MAIETFHWPLQIGNQPEVQYSETVRKVQFGDGYTQLSGTGLNGETITFPYAFRGTLDTAVEIRDFLRRHRKKSFQWTPPHEQPGLYRVVEDSIKFAPAGNVQGVITATFVQWYGV
ncbi:phage tail protein [Candidatus Symbiopectobacterium sp. NZEC135]|uniref:phage tail protein n=1 Tax=Candidatus Symbiopectobacterium sp. NZEC135 TaxID=2820471 RepID=UPI002227383B|nr:phage tail protein [Candidatus Symbiopectobacterium sp. NZEC135]MCW2480342.1 phage tail protein [Candidatus Symbiopectobacterium sp. NZEC135]